MAPIFDWNPEKNERLKMERGVSFEEVVVAVERGDILDIVQHPQRPNQKVMYVALKEYVYAVPFVENEETTFLKTIFPSRKGTQKFLKKDEDHEKD